MNSDSGANARFSVYEDEDSRYVALDYDNDGDYDVAVRVGDSEAAREPCVSKPRMKPGKASQLKILWEERRMSFVPCTKTEKPFSYLNARRFNKTGCCAKHIRP